jgi:hypothetical protein
MKRFWQFALVAAIALGAGAALDEGLHAVRNRKTPSADLGSNELFQRRLRCKTEADEYARKASEDNSSLMLEKVEFSPARRSCVAEFTRIISGKRGDIWSYETIDILTGETLFSDDCMENDTRSTIFCGNGRNMQLRKSRDRALNEALSNQSGK